MFSDENIRRSYVMYVATLKGIFLKLSTTWGRPCCKQMSEGIILFSDQVHKSETFSTYSPCETGQFSRRPASRVTYIYQG